MNTNMTKNTTDELRKTLLDKLALIKYGEAYKWLFDVDKLNVDLWTKDLQALISNREKLARLERGIYELERLHHIPQMFGDWENVIDDRIATLRKELDGGSDE